MSVHDVFCTSANSGESRPSVSFGKFQLKSNTRRTQCETSGTSDLTATSIHLAQEHGSFFQTWREKLCETDISQQSEPPAPCSTRRPLHIQKFMFFLRSYNSARQAKSRRCRVRLPSSLVSASWGRDTCRAQCSSPHESCAPRAESRGPGSPRQGVCHVQCDPHGVSGGMLERKPSKEREDRVLTLHKNGSCEITQ